MSAQDAIFTSNWKLDKGVQGLPSWFHPLCRKTSIGESIATPQSTGATLDWKIRTYVKAESSGGAFKQLPSVQQAHLPELTSVKLGAVSCHTKPLVTRGSDNPATMALVPTCQWQRSLLSHVNPKRSHLQNASRTEVPMDRGQESTKQS